MISIKIKGKTLKEWFQQVRREEFVKKEVGKGRILITWQDVDNMVYGWNMSADEESGLSMVSALISGIKHQKLVDTINGKEKVNEQGKSKW
jgi:hypothetical protein